MAEETKVELLMTEPIDIVRVTEDIDELTKKNSESNEGEKVNASTSRDEERQIDRSSSITTENPSFDDDRSSALKDETLKERVIDPMKDEENTEEKTVQNVDTSEKKSASETRVEGESNGRVVEDSTEKKDPVDVEYQRMSQEKIEIIKDVDEEEVCLRRGGSSGALSRSDSFSVKEEIEKIERQIKALESKNALERENVEDNARHDSAMTSPRLSIQENRQHFFENIVTNDRSGVKIEFKELPREQKDIHVVRLTDAPMPMAEPGEPVKVIELHISEPIRHRPELLDKVNPIPKPRRQNAFSLKDVSEFRLPKDENTSPEESNDKRGKSF